VNRLFGLMFLVVLIPFFLIISITIIINDGFPILFKQKRIGINNKEFWIYKFRTMKKNTPDIPTHLFKDSKYYYIKSGLFLRKYSLDELPQLLNIIKGDINFIGPRPALFNQEDLIKIRTIKGIHKIMPGISGWAQINGRDNLSITEKVEMDYFYLNNRSVTLDLKIIILTIYKVLKSADIS
tara:strand:- start:2344 stop:2889 length:546 start_codon:yes stop_codon:yes gene_type:complete